MKVWRPSLLPVLFKAHFHWGSQKIPLFMLLRFTAGPFHPSYLPKTAISGRVHRQNLARTLVLGRLGGNAGREIPGAAAKSYRWALATKYSAAAKKIMFGIHIPR